MARLVPANAATLLVVSLSLLPAASVFAQSASDPLRSPVCVNARAELEAALDEAAAARNSRSPRLAAARKTAADACLGGSNATPERAGEPDPVRIVPPTVTTLAPVAKPTFNPEPPRPPVDIPRPATITACDPAGCWDTQGRRLNNAGPLPIGPRGACSLQAGIVVCP